MEGGDRALVVELLSTMHKAQCLAASTINKNDYVSSHRIEGASAVLPNNNINAENSPFFGGGWISRACQVHKYTFHCE